MVTLKKKGEMSASALAIQVLKAINKSTESAVQLEHMPAEFCAGENINLSRWSMILNDDALKEISTQPLKHLYIDCSQTSIHSMLSSFWVESSAPNGLIHLNVTGAKQMTDYGLALVAKTAPNLRHLNISGCSRVTDSGLREVGLTCFKLQYLILSSCNGVEGNGFISIADNCRYLLKLNVAHCRQIQRFAFAKIFYSCNKLEEIDISGLHEVGDNEIRVLAQNCPNISTFVAIECPFVTDQSLLAISQHCPDLDILDVCRTLMPFRITDVGMLALGQRCQSLRILRCSGCDQISDVGLTWLSEGCIALEELNCSGCVKISDAGLRSIGNVCHSLTSIDISHAKLVSDVGLMFIASGCPNLKTLNCVGLYLLADPRLSAPKKGSKTVEAWEAVVGIAALDKYCRTVENLNLSGCFRMDKALRRHVSSLSTLKSLNLTGCNQSKDSSLVAVATGCTLLEHLNLSDCGKSVNSNSMQAFSTNCPNMKTLAVCRCDGVRSGAVKAIAALEKLEKLDLSGCRYITDVMLLPICETDNVPNLHQLTLSNLPLITDTTMAWLAHGCDCLLTLALKATNISHHAVQAVRDRFSYSDIIINDNYYGFWPKNRVEDRKLMNKYCVMTTGFTKLQALRRTVSAKKYVKNLIAERQYFKAVDCIHRAAQVFHARMIFCQKLAERRKLDHASSLIVSLFFIARAKVDLQRQRITAELEARHKRASMIQFRWRIHRDYRLGERMKEMARIYAVLVHDSAATIQSVARMRFAKQRVNLIKKLRESRFQLRNRKANVIQRLFRGFKGRNRARDFRMELYRRTTFKLVCARRIQFNFRAYRTRCIIAGRIAHTKLIYDSAILMQACFRGGIDRFRAAELRLELREEERDWAARKIQTRWLVKKAMIEVRLLLAARYRAGQDRIKACCRIQNAARCRRARLEFERRRKAHLESLRLMVEMELWGATKIQACFRAMKGRMKFMEAMREKKGKWKELFDEQKNKRFFYNQLTGEIRWRMPQDLLDLIPRPKCDNCMFYEAVCECGICNEMFCHQCFEQVHRGGRRKDHEFRSVYDYYGKRIDYGDGVFPCKWPSEVMQDEVQGWMLRVAPIRDPVAVYDNCWEEYAEADETGSYAGSAGSTNSEKAPSFYFNRHTFETSYDQPEEVRKALTLSKSFSAAEATNSCDPYEQYGDTYTPYHQQSASYTPQTSSYDTGLYSMYSTDSGSTMPAPTPSHDPFDNTYASAGSIDTGSWYGYDGQGYGETEPLTSTNTLKTGVSVANMTPNLASTPLKKKKSSKSFQHMFTQSLSELPKHRAKGEKPSVSSSVTNVGFSGLMSSHSVKK